MENFRLIFIVLIISIFTLFGCSQNSNNQKDGTSQASIDGRSQIKWLGQWYGEGKKEALVRELASDFSFQNQKYQVKLEFPHEMLKIDGRKATYGLMILAIQKMVEDNIWPYDLMVCDSYLYQAVANKVNDPNWGEKYLVDFKNEPWFINAHQESLFKSDYATKMFGGIAPGVYIEGVWNVLYVSSIAEQKLGIKAKRYDMTLDDFTSYAKVVYDYNISHADKITFLWLERTTDLIGQLIMSALGKESAANDKEGFSVLEHIYSELEKTVPYHPLDQYSKAKTDKDLYEDKIFFVYNPSWISLIWQAKKPEGEKKMHPCELPSMAGGKAISYSGLCQAIFVVPKNAQNKEGAIQLMKYISSSETAEKWVKYTKCPTAIKHKEIYSDFSKSEINQFSQHLKAKYNDNLQDVNLSHVLFNSNKKVDYVKLSLEIMRGNITTREAMKKVKEQLAAR